MKTKTSKKNQILDEVEGISMDEKKRDPIHYDRRKMRTLNYSTVKRGSLKTRQRTKHNQHLPKVNLAACSAYSYCNWGNHYVN